MISIAVGRCRVEFHFGFAAAVTFLLLADKSGIGIAGAVAAILHEAGHLICMQWLGVPAIRVKFGLFGLEILEEKRSGEAYTADIFIALAGPFANLVVFLLLLPFQLFFPSPLCFRLLSVNAVLAAFHLLPVEPLDGGQALYAALCRRLPIHTAERLTSAISFLTLLPLGLLGFLVLLRSRYNFTLLLISGYLMLLMLLKKGRYY